MKTLLQVSVLMMLASSSMRAGLDLKPGDLSVTLRAWRTIVRGLCASLLLVPLITLLIVRWWGLDGPLAIGLVVLSVCPGAPTLVFKARRVGGSTLLAAVLTYLLGMLTALTAAPSARLLLAYTGPLAIHPLSIIGKLILAQSLPLAIGRVVRSKSPRWAGHLERVLPVLAGVAAMVVVALAVLPRLPAIAAMGWSGALATAVTMALALAFGALMGENREASRTLAELAAVPNIGLAILLVTGAQASKVVLATIVGIFLLRALLNAALIATGALLARARARRPGPRPAA